MNVCMTVWAGVFQRVCGRHGTTLGSRSLLHRGFQVSKPYSRNFSLLSHQWLSLGGSLQQAFSFKTTHYGMYLLYPGQAACGQVGLESGQPDLTLRVGVEAWVVRPLKHI